MPLFSVASILIHHIRVICIRRHPRYDGLRNIDALHSFISYNHLHTSAAIIKPESFIEEVLLTEVHHINIYYSNGSFIPLLLLLLIITAYYY